MTDIVVTSEDDFDSLIFEEGEEYPVLVLFTAPTWCVPCRQFEPHWTKAQELLPNHVFAKVDMGLDPEATAHHWASIRFGIRGVPAVKLFDGSKSRDIKVPQGVIAFVREVNGG